MAVEPCRYIGARPGHQCSRNDGSPLGRNGVCFYEAAAQMREQAGAEGVEHTTDPTVYRLLAQGAVNARRQAERESEAS